MAWFGGCRPGRRFRTDPSGLAQQPLHNVVLFVADGLRPGMVRRRRNKRVPAKQRLTEDVRRLPAAWLAAVRHEMNIETRQGRPGYAAYERTVRASDAPAERLVRPGDRILKRRV